MEQLLAEISGGRKFTITRKEPGSSAEELAAAEKDRLAAEMDEMIQARGGDVNKK